MNDECPDCGVAVGEKHEEGCDVARCKGCGMQQLQCTLHDDWEMTTWKGEWPGLAECRELDYWTTNPILLSEGQTRIEDLNQLTWDGVTRKLTWNTIEEKWTRP